MNKYLLVSLLLIASFCNAMHLSDEDGEYKPSGKASSGKRDLSPRAHESSSSDEDKLKHARVSGQKSVQKGKLFAVNPADTTEVSGFADRASFTKTNMRRLVTGEGITLSTVVDQIKALWQAQDTDALREDNKDLKQYCMQCPSCELVLESGTDERTLFNQVFKHWFFTAQHQPKLFTYMINLMATTEADARAKFKARGLPKAAIVQLPQPAGEPMDEDEDEDEDEEENQEDQEGDQEQEDNEEFAISSVDEQAKAWYIVDQDPTQKSMARVFEAASRPQVVALYLASKIPHLSRDCPEVHAQGKLLKTNEELSKQLLVQDKKVPKKLVCTDPECEVMLAQDDASEKSLSALFASMAFHQMKTHPIESDNELAKKATQLAASSFEKAFAKCAE